MEEHAEDDRHGLRYGGRDERHRRLGHRLQHAAVLHDAGQHAGASRMEAMSNEARTCASIRCRCMSTSR